MFKRMVFVIVLTALVIMSDHLATAKTSDLHSSHLHKPLILGLSGSTYWSSGSNKISELVLHYRTKVRPLNLYVGRDHPNGTQITVVFGNSGVNLMLVAKHPGLFDDDADAFDDDGELKSGYYMQVGQCDIQHNGNPYIVIAVGDALTELHITVLKYHPPVNQEDAIRLENWEEVGSFTGQAQARIDGDTIDLPFGSVGLATEYTLVKGRFVETDDLRRQD